jgi:prepilin-type N-terminal cleavage/methylation domain-containing protein
MEMTKMTKLKCRMTTEQGFTLIELLVVIAIIAALLGLAFPVFQGVLDRAKKVQAKNDVTQIVTAVNAFYTEYGKYPLVTDDTPIANTADLFYTLRAVASGANAPVNGVPAINPRAIVFISPPDVKDTTNPRSGIGSNGQYYDPWGTPYVVTIDGNYDNQIANPYSDSDGSAGAAQLRSGVIAYSVGKNGALGGGSAASSKYAAESGTAGKYKHSSDVISWQ